MSKLKNILGISLLIAVGGILFYWYKKQKGTKEEYCAFIRVPGPEGTFIGTNVCASTPQLLEDKLSQMITEDYADISYY